MSAGGFELASSFESQSPAGSSLNEATDERLVAVDMLDYFTFVVDDQLLVTARRGEVT